MFLVLSWTLCNHPSRTTTNVHTCTSYVHTLESLPATFVECSFSSRLLQVSNCIQTTVKQPSRRDFISTTRKLVYFYRFFVSPVGSIVVFLLLLLHHHDIGCVCAWIRSRRGRGRSWSGWRGCANLRLLLLGGIRGHFRIAATPGHLGHFKSMWPLSIFNIIFSVVFPTCGICGCCCCCICMVLKSCCCCCCCIIIFPCCCCCCRIMWKFGPLLLPTPPDII